MMRSFLIPILVTCSLAPGSGWAQNAAQPEALKMEGAVAMTHDPSIARDGNTYYVFATGRARGDGQLPIRCSEDLHTWRMCGKVFNAIPAWIHETSQDTKDLWAPDISFTHGEYRLYYVFSIFGKRTSGIALMTNKTLDPNAAGYGWVDKGLVLRTSEADDYNAIDPAYVEDEKGKGWLAFGSYWMGIKMRAVDVDTGLLSDKQKKMYSLAQREGGPEGNAVEAPYVVAHDKYYYLFVSFGFCCRGAQSTYRVMVGRSKKVTGPYKDKSGKKMMDGGGTEVLSGNAEWVGPGGESVMHDRDGTDVMVFHAYDMVTGRPQLQISRIAWRDGWPEAALSTDPPAARP